MAASAPLSARVTGSKAPGSALFSRPWSARNRGRIAWAEAWFSSSRKASSTSSRPASSERAVAWGMAHAIAPTRGTGKSQPASGQLDSVVQRLGQVQKAPAGTLAQLVIGADQVLGLLAG